MSVTKPFVSVLMSCYNAELWVSETITSILEQTFRDYEFIIVDDGSADETRKIIEKFASEDNRITPLFKPNSGLPDSLNCGLNVAKGEWIARIDADDLCESKRLETQVKRVLSDPEIVLLGSNYREIDEHGTIGKTERYPEYHRELVANLRNMKRFFAHSSAFYNTRAAKSLGGYNKKIKKAEDWKLWLDLSERGKVACVQENLVRIRTHSNQISFSDGGVRQLYDTIAAIVCHNLKLRNYPDPSNTDFEDWTKFITWIEDEVNKTRFFQEHEFKRRLKQVLYDSGYVFKSEIFLSFLDIRNLISVCITLLFGNSLPKKLTNNWTKICPINLPK